MNLTIFVTGGSPHTVEIVEPDPEKPPHPSIAGDIVLAERPGTNATVTIRLNHSGALALARAAAYLANTTPYELLEKRPRP